MEATALMTTGDHLFGEVIVGDTDAAVTKTTSEWQGTAIWTDRSRLEDGSVGCAVARYDSSACLHGQELGGLRR